MIQIPILLNSSKISKTHNSIFDILGRLISALLTLILLCAIYKTYQWGQLKDNKTIIIIITPTYKRPERIADLTRFFFIFLFNSFYIILIVC